MNCLRICKWSVAFAVVLSTACTSVIATNHTAVLTEELTAEAVAETAPTDDASSTETHVAVAVESQHPTPTAVALHSQCPIVVANNMFTLWPSGSILFSKTDQSGIWAISANDLNPKLVYDAQSGQPSSVIVSDNGTKLLLLFEQVSLENGFEEETIIYDLNTRGETIVPVPVEAWAPVWGWLSDGRIEYLVDLEQLPDFGERREFILIDPRTQQTEVIVEELELPGYVFNDLVLYSEITSISPSGKIALYNAFDSQGNKIVLQYLQTGSVIWKQKGNLIGVSFPKPIFLTPDPEWDTDSNRVVFSAFISENDGDHRGIFSLTHDGQLEQLIDFSSLPTDKEQNWIPRYLSHSPNGRYLNYGLGRATDRPPRDRGPGFILDITSSETGEICDPKTTFIDGKWVSENQLLYRVYQENGSQSLRVLDVPTWTTQILFEASPGHGIKIMGWTPVEFP